MRARSRTSICACAFGYFGDWFATAEDIDMERGSAPVALRANGREDGPGRYAAFFTDPYGNKLEVCHVTRG